MAYASGARRLALATAIAEHNGNLRHVAHALGYHRSHIYRLIYQHKLWAVVNSLRKKRIERNARERIRS